VDFSLAGSAVGKPEIRGALLIGQSIEEPEDHAHGGMMLRWNRTEYKQHIENSDDAIAAVGRQRFQPCQHALRRVVLRCPFGESPEVFNCERDADGVSILVPHMVSHEGGGASDARPSAEVNEAAPRDVAAAGLS